MASPAWATADRSCPGPGCHAPHANPGPGISSARRSRFVFWPAAGSRYTVATTSADAGTLSSSCSPEPLQQEERARRPPATAIPTTAATAISATLLARPPVGVAASDPRRRASAARRTASGGNSSTVGGLSSGPGGSVGVEPSGNDVRPKDVRDQGRSVLDAQACTPRRRSGRGVTPMPGPVGHRHGAVGLPSRTAR